MNVGTYVSRKNNNLTVKVVEVDEKTKTLIYEGADGKTHSVSWSSFRKSYKSEDAPVIEKLKSVEKTAEKQDNISENAHKADEKSAEKVEKPKKERKPREKKEKLPVSDKVKEILQKYLVNHKVAGKRIYLLDADNKKYGVIRAMTNQARIYLEEDSTLYNKTVSMLEYTVNTGSYQKKDGKSRYPHTAVIEFDMLETIIKEAK